MTSGSMTDAIFLSVGFMKAAVFFLLFSLYFKPFTVTVSGSSSGGVEGSAGAGESVGSGSAEGSDGGATVGPDIGAAVGSGVGASVGSGVGVSGGALTVKVTEDDLLFKGIRLCPGTVAVMV